MNKIIKGKRYKIRYPGGFDCNRVGYEGEGTCDGEYGDGLYCFKDLDPKLDHDCSEGLYAYFDVVKEVKKRKK